MNSYIKERIVPFKKMLIFPRIFINIKERMTDEKKEKKITVMTSTVIKSTENWYEFGLLIPHETLRMAMNDMLDVTQPKYFDVDKHPWKYQHFYKWYDEFFFPFIHHHHYNEEKIYIPWLKTKIKQFPAKIADDHKQLLALLDEVKKAEQNFIDAKNDSSKLLAAAEDLRKRLHTLVEHTNQHLAEEETVIPPLLKENFTEKEEEKPIQQIIKQNGLAGNRKELPWIIDAVERWGGPDILNNRLLPKIPGVIKSLYFKYWRNEYEMTNVALIQSIKLDKQPTPPTQHCCCCCRWFAN